MTEYLAERLRFTDNKGRARLQPCRKSCLKKRLQPLRSALQSLNSPWTHPEAQAARASAAWVASAPRAPMHSPSRVYAL